jgi:hypothetical protein
MKIQKRFTYANVTATLALVFAMSGGALAASHYVITSTKQISPKVVKALKGQNGTAGAAGPAGPAGAAGAAGKEGPAGKDGPAGSAVAFAYIQGMSKPPSLTNAKNVTSVTKVTSGGVEAAGEYCISVSVPFQNITGITDIAFGGGNGVTVSANTAIVPLVIAANECPPSTSVVVETGSEKEAKDANFWISFN